MVMWKDEQGKYLNVLYPLLRGQLIHNLSGIISWIKLSKKEDEERYHIVLSVEKK